jgi:dipeptidyl aminopeptidase/acylaminoacyl peptidase
VLAVVLALLLAGAFLAGRATAPGDDGPGAARTTTTASPDAARKRAAARRQDDAAKEAVRNAVAFVESCVAASADRDPTRCRTKDELNVGSTLPLVDDGEPAAGQVAVSASPTGYRVVSVSASGNRFVLSREGAGVPVRTCTAGVAGAGCAGGAW